MAHDRVGNMTRVPRRDNWAAHYDLTYDAWNRLATVFDVETTVAEYAYDGRDFRTTATSAGTVRHSYYSRTWQALEERVGSSGAADRQFTWGLRYIDDLVLRDRDANGTPPERLYAIQDPNWNVTVLANSSGATQERYAYEAYGKVAFFTDSFGSRTSSGYAWNSLYTGRQYDPEAELYYLRARYFDASLGTFSTRDPISYRGGINLYRYVGNNPMRLADLLGTQGASPGSGAVSGDLINACIEACGISEDTPYGDLLTNECFNHCIGNEVGPPEGIPVPPDGSAPTAKQRECCKKWSGQKSWWGMSTCCDGEKLICGYDAHAASGLGGSPDSQALQIIRLCIISHERTHLEQFDCCPDKVYKPGYGSYYKRECEAFEAKLGCLKSKKDMCGSNSKCKQQVASAIARAELAIRICRASLP